LWVRWWTFGFLRHGVSLLMLSWSCYKVVEVCVSITVANCQPDPVMRTVSYSKWSMYS
jgi:hypothetical protein